jgi:IS30 family transposase
LQDWERDEIAILRSSGSSNKEIARKLKRDPSTIGREIARNSFKGKYYVAIHAQGRWEKRKSSSGKRHPLKNKKVFKWVILRLLRGWSPEQISGRMRLVFPTDPNMRICPETIYAFTYSDKYKYRKLWEYLPRGRKKRKHKSGRSVRKECIPGRISIHLRPSIVDGNTDFGHFEGDTVEGKAHKASVHTEVERFSRKYFVKKVESITSEEALRAQIEIFTNLPEEARKSVTLDNGRENHLHGKLNKLGMKTYFCDPYSSWQKGSNEYHNSLLRRYFPKGTDFSKVTQEEIDDCVSEINNTPRKCLGYYTPNEVFFAKLNNTKVAIQSRM